MTRIEHANDASLADFLAGWDKRLQENEQFPVGWVVMGLTNFGERPVPSTRLAEVLDLPVSEAEARAQGHCTSGARVEGGLMGLRTGSSPSTPSAQNQLPGASSRSVTAGSA